MNKPSRRLHATQSAYLSAVDAHESAVKATADECTAKGYVIVAGQADEDFTKACESIDAVNLAHNVWNLWDARHLAGYAVAEWSIERAIVGCPAEAARLTGLLNRVRTLPVARLREVIELAMRLPL